ncbi:MAG: GerMN domain-containing protein [Abitibacteriaceae bacterium]|nr:GerMN domain-containing protein [Abditibacteriaceae bacterium]
MQEQPAKPVESAEGTSPHNGQEQPPVRPPKRPLTPWVLLILPLALLIGLIFVGRQDFMPSDQTKPLPVKPLAVKPVPTKAVPDHSRYTLYVPGDDALLHEEVVSKLDDAPTINYSPDQFQTWYEQQAQRTLELLFQKSAPYLPADSKVSSVNLKKDVVSVNLDKNFQNSKVWQGETSTQLAVYAIVNTLTSQTLNRDGKTKKVQLLVDNKPVETLGGLDTSDPIEPNMALVAKS